MKLTSILLFVACFQLSAAGYSQSISLSEKNATIETIFEKIKEQSGYLFWYRLDLLKETSKININIKSASIEQALNQVLKNQPLTFEIIDKTIVVKSNTETASAEKTINIRGKVTDDKGGALPGASVKVKGSTVATSTNLNGEFELRGIDEDAVLVVSYLGFTTQEIKITTQPVINIILKEDTQGLNEVVVVGYGEVRRRDITGSVGSVKMADMEKAPVRSFEEALAGRVAGVTASSDDGQPGASVN
ncbi:MAG TPA: carboxypeptidase-like regulatory domain-containing protein, partial [Sphingobacteriaceae bacterium]